MIFNPYGWSTVVNCTVNLSLISATLISLSLYNLSSERFSWETCHLWMKGNAEVATNINRQDSERGSEEVNRKCCSCMKRSPVIKILVTVVLGLWPAGNI